MSNSSISTIRPPSPNARRGQRASVDGRARFREAGQNPFDADLFDLSSSGFRMFSFSRQTIGKRIWVSLPGLELREAIVRRAEGNNYGCEFAEPLHPSVASHLQATLSR